jgi:small GTP-binding protein
LLIWDTAGQERYRSMANVYYRDAAVALILYSITDRETYTDVDAWLHRVIENAPPDVIIFLVGSKADLETDRVVTFDEAGAKAEALGASFFEVSALTGDGVETLFTAVATQALSVANAPKTGNVKLETAPVKESSGCC